MAVSLGVNRLDYNGNGVTIEFPCPYFLDDQDMKVYRRLDDAEGTEELWTLGTQYTLSGKGDEAGGLVTVITAPTDYTPQPGETLTNLREVPEVQETQYPESGKFPSIALERNVDRLTMMVQENTELLGRTFSIPVTDTQAGDFELPNDIARSNMFLAFDDEGNPIVAPGTQPSTAPISAYMEGALTKADAAAARAYWGSTVIGDALYTAADADAGRQTLEVDEAQIWLAGQFFG